MNGLQANFAALRAAGKKTVLPFVTAGYPDLETTAALLHEFAGAGVRVCELGIPFSDPIADGPVIQASYTQALADGVTSDKIFDMVRQFRSETSQNANSQLAIVAMVSYSIVFRHGPEAYLRQAKQAGIDGLIIPDLPLDEAAATSDLAATLGLCNILLVAPTTGPQRRLEIAQHSQGFIYYMSIAGITGQRDSLPDSTIAGVAELRRHTDKPVCVGFGVSNARTVQTVCSVADGAIVGSAIVKRITEARAAGADRQAIVAKVGQFVQELMSPLK